MALVVPMAAADGVGPYDNTVQVWSPHPLPVTPSVPGHPLDTARHGAATAKPAHPVKTYKTAKAVWPSAGIRTVTLGTPAAGSAAGSQTAAAATGADKTAAATAKANTAEAGKAVKATDLPVWVTPLAPARTKAPSTAAATEQTASTTASSVRVEMAGHAQAKAVGIDGLLAGFTRTDDAHTPTTDRVTLDYSSIARAYGGGWASRLHLVTLPGCALTTPSLPSCRASRPLKTTNDPATGTLSATITLGGTPAAATSRAMAMTQPAAAPQTVVAAVSSTGGSQGAYTATSLNPSGTWSASGTGAFTYSYPITVPPSLGGSAPAVALSYDSQSVDGETSARNSQSSWIGDGWSYSPGFIERSLKPCTQDNLTGSGDLCWGGELLTLSLGGHSDVLVRDGASNPSDLSQTQTYHLQDDDGTKVQELSGATNGLWNGEYFKVTTTDGTSYYFGLNHAPGQSSDAATNSAWGEPVYNPKSADPCYSSAQGTASECTMGYRFNLDFVVDPHSNLQRYDYATESNYYDMGGGQVAASGGSGTLTKYTRGGYLTQISYGYQLADEIAGRQPAAQVVFNTSQRCQTSASFTDCSYGNLKDSTATNWPDVPYDLNCASGDSTDPTDTGSDACLVGSPTFWSTYRLDSITTQVRTGATSFAAVDTYQLHQIYSDAGGVVDPVTGNTGVDAADVGELQSVMWLDSIQHTGDDTTAGATASTTLPKVTFTGTEIDNRVDGLTPGAPELYRPRISSLTTETGEGITVTYNQPDCSRVNGTMPASPDSDTMSCYNVYWTTPGGTTPISDWFNKTTVQTVTIADLTGAGSRQQVTNYGYAGAAWHRDDSALTDNTYRTWDQFRGYRTVTVATGDPGFPSDPVTKTVTTYLQGMDGDYKADGTTRSVSVPDTVGDSVTDSDQLVGTPLESDTYTNGAVGGTVDAKTVSGPWTFTTTATRTQTGLPSLVARMLTTSRDRAYSLLANGNWRETETDSTYNGNGQPSQIDNKGDVSVPAQETCGTITYATPPAGNPMMVAYPDETLDLAGPCSTTPSTTTTLSDKRYYYDGDGTITNPGTLGSLGTTGNLTAVQIATGYSGATPTFQTISGSQYDSYGRVTKSTNTEGNATTTSFSSAVTGTLPTSSTSTNWDGWSTSSTLDPLRGLSTLDTDTNSRKTATQYDALGRRTAVWLPGRDAGTQSADMTYTYAVNGTSAPSTVTTHTLREDGSYQTQVDIYDGMLQERQTQTTTADNSDGRLISDTFYDSHGWPVKTSAAYYDKTADPSTTMWVANDNAVPSQTVTVYDGQGRPTASQLWSYASEAWQSTTAYPGADRTDTVPPSGGTPSSTFTNALGQTTATWAYHDAQPTGHASDAANAYATNYTYTPAGRVNTMTDANGNTWSYSYNMLGEETSQTDPDTGTTTFNQYDTSGELLQSTDARGQVLSYAYDAYGRKSAEYSGPVSGQGTTDTELASWAYDTLGDGTKVNGYPVSSTRYVAGKQYTEKITGYNTAYQPTGESTTIPDGTGTFPSNGTGTGTNTYTTTATYSPNIGQLAETHYNADAGLPDETIGYGYDLQGLLNGFGDETTPYLNLTNYTPFGQVVHTNWGPYGQQIATDASYDMATGRLATSDVDLQPGTTDPLDSTTYAYDQAGDLTGLSDLQTTPTGALVNAARQPQSAAGPTTSVAQTTPTFTTATDTQCFAYNQLQRLTTAWSDNNTTHPLTVAASTGTTSSNSAGTINTIGSVGTCTNSAPTTASPHVGGPAPYWQSYAYDPLGDRTGEVQNDPSGTTANNVTQSTTYPGNGTAAAAQPNAATQTTTTGPAGAVTSAPAYADGAGNTTSRTTTTVGTMVSGLTRVSGTTTTKLCADDASASTTDANPIDLYTCNGTGAQSWTIGSDGTVRVLGKCLHAVSSGTAVGTKIELYDCISSAGELWYPTTDGSLFNPHSQKCLDVPGGSTTNSTQLQLATCTGAAEQRWTNAATGTTLAGAKQTFGYDEEGRTSSVTTPATTDTAGAATTPTAAAPGPTTQSTSYIYDADGNLLLQTTPTGQILYLFGGAEQLTLKGTTVTGQRYYPGPDGITEVRTSTTSGTSTLAYEVTNTQGTATTTIDAATLAVTRRFYDPYGAPRGPASAPWTDNHGYLGQPTDATTGLDLLGARQYDPTQGRFLTADPILEAGDPNQMGGYTYAADNPTTGSDPDGTIYRTTGDGTPVGPPLQGAAPPSSGSGSTNTSSGGTTAAPDPNNAYQSDSSYLCGHVGACNTIAGDDTISPQLYQAFVLPVVDLPICLAHSFTLRESSTCDVAASLFAGGDLGGGGDEPDANPEETGGAASHTASDMARGSAEASGAGASAIGEDMAADAQALTAAKRAHAEAIDEEAANAKAEPSDVGTGAHGTPAAEGDTPGNGPCSFSPDTPVLMAGDTTKAIGKIKPGDKVESADPATGKHVGARPVTHVWINHDNDLLDVTVRTGAHHTATLHTTANHPFWDDTTHRWTPAGKLTPGHTLATPDGRHIPVVRVHATPGTAYRWNLTVSQLHTYYVMAGTTPVLVHNTCGEGKVWEPFREGVDHTDQGTLPADAGIPAGASLDPGEYHFIVRQDGSLHAMQNESMWDLNPDAGHTSLGDRQGVLMAGTFDVDANGAISRVDNFSGHYQPTGSTPLLNVTRRAFQGHGWNFSDDAWDYYAGPPGH